jgi:hypothetical protein
MGHDYQQFMESDGGQVFDQQMEKSLDDFIRDKMDKGYGDMDIIEAYTKSLSGKGASSQAETRTPRTEQDV